MHGVRWRRNPDGLHPVLARALGFRRNHGEGEHESARLSPTDRLVHATWNALAHAFLASRRTAAAGCTVDAAAVLEDDLLPAPDLVAFLEHGRAVMQASLSLSLLAERNVFLRCERRYVDRVW